LALLNALLATRLSAWRRRHEPGAQFGVLRLAGGVSLACWLTAISCGRMLGYW